MAVFVELPSEGERGELWHYWWLNTGEPTIRPENEPERENYVVLPYPYEPD